MSENNVQRNERKRCNRQRTIDKIIVPILFVAAFIVSIHFLFGRNNSLSRVIVNSADDQKNPTISSIEPEENDNLQSLNAGTNWNLTLVNKWNPLPENYEITLVEVPGGEKVDKQIYEPLMEMLKAAKEHNRGQLPKVVSGFRTQEKQQELFDEKIEEFKKQGYSDNAAFEQATLWVSVPGYSEHQLGFAVDINGVTYDLYMWLQENSYKYGFIFRYPAGKSDITGVTEEVWHYRYVGVDAATEIYEQGLCLEEYLDGKSKLEGRIRQAEDPAPLQA